MLAINPGNSVVEAASTYPANHATPIAMAPTVAARVARPFGSVSPLLDHAAEARRFFALDGRGMVKRDAILAQAPGRDGGDFVLLDAVNSLCLIKPGQQRLSSIKFQRLEEQPSRHLPAPAIPVFQAAVAPPSQRNALMQAILKGQLPVARQLLAALDGSLQALAVDGRGRNALMLAALHGQADFAEILLSHPSAHAQAAALDDDNMNALMLAVSAGRCAIIRLLLAHGATAGQVVEVAKNGDDALIIAARAGHYLPLALILADPMATILLDGETPQRANALTLAAQNGHTHAVEALLSAMTVQQAARCDNQGRNALMLAAENGHAETVCLLLAHPKTHGLAVAVDGQGFNALMIAAWRGRYVVVEALLSGGNWPAQVECIPKRNFEILVAKVLNLDRTMGGMLVGVPPLKTGDDRTELIIKRVVIDCSTNIMKALLPMMARIMAEKTSDA